MEQDKTRVEDYRLKIYNLLRTIPPEKWRLDTDGVATVINGVKIKLGCNAYFHYYCQVDDDGVIAYNDSLTRVVGKLIISAIKPTLTLKKEEEVQKDLHQIWQKIKPE